MTLPEQAQAPDIFDEDPWGDPLRLSRILKLRPTVVVLLGPLDDPRNASLLQDLVSDPERFGAERHVVAVVQADAAELKAQPGLPHAALRVYADPEAQIARLFLVQRSPVLGGVRGLLSRRGLKRALDNATFGRPLRQVGERVASAAFLIDQENRVVCSVRGPAIDWQGLVRRLPAARDLRTDKERRKDERAARRKARLASMADAGRTGRETDTDPESGDRWAPTRGSASGQ